MDTIPTASQPATAPAPVKPGYLTTEFWLKLGAIALSALFASGIIPTSGPAATIAAMAATMLGALGYTVSRTLVKNAAGAVLVLLLGLTAAGTLTACTAAQVRQDAAAGLVAAFHCEASGIDPAALADAQGFAEARIQGWISGTAPSDLTALKSRILGDIKPVRSDLGRCAIAGALAVIAAVAAPTPGVAVSALTAGPDPALVRAAFAGAAREAGWPPLQLPGGAVI